MHHTTRERRGENNVHKRAPPKNRHAAIDGCTADSARSGICCVVGRLARHATKCRSKRSTTRRHQHASATVAITSNAGGCDTEHHDGESVERTNAASAEGHEAPNSQAGGHRAKPRDTAVHSVAEQADGHRRARRADAHHLLAGHGSAEGWGRQARCIPMHRPPQPGDYVHRNSDPTGSLLGEQVVEHGVRQAHVHGNQLCADDSQAGLHGRAGEPGWPHGLPAYHREHKTVTLACLQGRPRVLSILGPHEGARRQGQDLCFEAWRPAARDVSRTGRRGIITQYRRVGTFHRHRAGEVTSLF